MRREDATLVFMGSRNRTTLATVFLILILVAIPAAGVIQTIWLNDASRAELDRLQRSLGNATRQIRADLAFELASVRTLFRPDLEAATPTEAIRALEKIFPDYYEVWADQSRFPGLLSDVVYVDPRDEGEVYSYQPGSGTFELESRPYPQWLNSVLGPSRGETGVQLVIPSLTVVIPLERGAAGSPFRDGSATIRDAESPYLVARIDGDYLTTEVLPGLIEVYLGSDDYDVTILDANGDLVWSVPEIQSAANSITLENADEVTRLSVWSIAAVALPDALAGGSDGSVREDVLRRFQDPILQQWLGFRPPRDQQPPESGENDDTQELSPVPELSDITIMFRHRVGGIPAAARVTRNRNLTLSYLALLVLAGATIVYYVLFRRANRQRDREHEFVATVTHELRTPIAAISAVADNLAEGIVRDPEQVQTYGAALLDEGRRLRMMIDQVLAYAGLQGASHKNHIVSVNLRELVDHVCNSIPEIRQAQFTVRVEPDLQPFRGDRIALESIIHNLVSNAFKHNSESTLVWLTVAADHQSLPGSSRTGSGLRLEVRDNGRGIPRPELRRVREPFYRGSQSQADQIPGSGLGLSLVERIVETYSGRLDITSGNGTTVTVRLPSSPGGIRGR